MLPVARLSRCVETNNPGTHFPGQHRQFMKYLLILCFALQTPVVFSQAFTSYFTGNATDVVTPSLGGVCLMGGASEHDEAMKWFLQRASGGDILVLRASGSDGYNNYMYSQLGVTVNSVETIVFNNASAANDAYVHQKIMGAEAIWFAGGDQWDYVSYWRNTAVDSLINDGLQNRNIVIGGTSAGMAIQGEYYFSAQYGTVTSAQALANPYNNNMSVDSAHFLENNWLTDVITDTHYDDPDRKGRHVTFLARIFTDYGIPAKGIACDEYTAVCIDANGLAHVYGDYPNYDENIYFIQPNCELADMTPEDCSSGNPLEWNRGGAALKVYAIKGTNDGSKSFDLSDWTTGSGGAWENWYVNNGTLLEFSSNQINCAVRVDEIFGKTETIRAFPNPAQNQITFRSDRGPILGITVMSPNGSKLIEQSNQRSKVSLVDLSQLSAGIYIAHIRTSTDSIFIKIMKQ